MAVSVAFVLHYLYWISLTAFDIEERGKERKVLLFFHLYLLRNLAADLTAKMRDSNRNKSLAFCHEPSSTPGTPTPHFYYVCVEKRWRLSFIQTQGFPISCMKFLIKELRYQKSNFFYSLQHILKHFLYLGEKEGFNQVHGKGCRRRDFMLSAKGSVCKNKIISLHFNLIKVTP